MTLYRIAAPHFVAGVVVDAKGMVICTAPILNWASGWSMQSLMRYARKKRWSVEFLRDSYDA